MQFYLFCMKFFRRNRNEMVTFTFFAIASVHICRAEYHNDAYAPRRRPKHRSRPQSVSRFADGIFSKGAAGGVAP